MDRHRDQQNEEEEEEIKCRMGTCSNYTCLWCALGIIGLSVGTYFIYSPSNIYGTPRDVSVIVLL